MAFSESNPSISSPKSSSSERQEKYVGDHGHKCQDRLAPNEGVQSLIFLDLLQFDGEEGQ